jgi:hypothetical protein
MARRQIYTSDSYSIEFDTAGSGTYWLVSPDGDKGPYTTEDAAKRAGAAFLESKLSPGLALESRMLEDEEVLRRAEERDRNRFATEPEREAAEEVDDLIARAQTKAAKDRRSIAEAVARQLKAQEPKKNAAAEGADAVTVPKFKFPNGGKK